VNRQPFIVGPAVDKLLGFLAGFFGNVMGLIATIVVMFVWAGGNPTPETPQRRSHATSVSLWSGLGCLIPVILMFALIAYAIWGMSYAPHGPRYDPTLAPLQTACVPDPGFPCPIQ
jgi:hypothetical protein